MMIDTDSRHKGQNYDFYLSPTLQHEGTIVPVTNPRKKYKGICVLISENFSMGLIFKCLLFLQNLYASMTDKDTADISSTVHLTHCETQFMQLFSFNIFDYKEQNIHNPFPNHKEIKSKEESKNASTISHQRHQWKSFHLFSDKDFFTSEHWPYL